MFEPRSIPAVLSAPDAALASFSTRFLATFAGAPVRSQLGCAEIMGAYGYAGTCSRLTAAELVGLYTRSLTWVTSGFHARQLEPRHRLAGHPYGDGDGAGVVVCGGGRVLGGASGCGCSGDRRTNGIVSGHHFRGWG